MSPSRKSVVKRRIDGKIEKSRASFIYMVKRRMTRERARLRMNIKSSSQVGSGTISSAMMITMNIATEFFRKFKFILAQFLFPKAVNESQYLRYRLIELLGYFGV